MQFRSKNMGFQEKLSPSLACQRKSATKVTIPSTRLASGMKMKTGGENENFSNESFSNLNTIVRTIRGRELKKYDLW